MSNPTSNFGWQMPTNSDLVTDLPADFEVFGQGVDTTLADLKGGTTGQMLTKTSNTDMDFTWVTPQIGDITAITATTPLTGGGTSGDVTIGIQSASTSQSGAVQLTDSTSSTSTSTAATPNSVKSAYDLANAAIPKSLVDAKGDIVSATADNTPSRVAVGNNGEQLLADSTNTSGLRWTATPSASNLVLNSAMNVWQRGTSLGASGSQFIADRWNFFRDLYATGITVSQQATNDTTNLPNIQYCQRVQRDSGNTSTAGLQTTQNIETVNSIPFAGKTVTLSFYARKGANFSSASSIMAVSLYSGTGTDQALRNGFTNSTLVISQNTTLTTTWQRFSYTGTIASNATQLGLSFYFTPSGTAGAADYFELTGVQIDIGNVALPYRAYGATYQAELAACQRYYIRWSNTSSGFLGGNGAGVTTTVAKILYQLPVELRTTPTAIDYSSVALFDGTSILTGSTPTIASGAATKAVAVDNTVASSVVQYRPYFNIANGTGYIGLSAEL